MHIEFIEIANFRKLLSTRVDLADTTTLFVGANNSGKTSAMLALRRFLTPRRCPFEIHDFTLCHWREINKIGDKWIAAHNDEERLELSVRDWVNVLPMLDLWLNVNEGEMHHVQDLIPTMEWEGGRLGVRLRFEPKNIDLLYKDFIQAVVDATSLRSANKKETNGEADEPEQDEESGVAGQIDELSIWPNDFIDFLSKKLLNHFTVRIYPLDPANLSVPVHSMASLQELPAESEAVEGDPLAGLIRVHDIPAQRGFGEERANNDDEDASYTSSGSRLSVQLRSYYSKHLDPTKVPDAADLEALRAIELAQIEFDKRLTESFGAAFAEVEGMGYPGVTDPRPRVSTRLKAIDGLNHSAAVSFEIDVVKDGEEPPPLFRLPEAYNGLGYQNLISMIFRLMSFRDAWMRVGKASKEPNDAGVEPLHLVLVEEPEAHLHAQVQQVFIKKAYGVLRAHADLKGNDALRTQLVVSTHSSHVAHETPFAYLRYFRRLPAGMEAAVPVSKVINLSEVFGGGVETERFVTRYLRSQHADLFFADAAILVEGPAERMLVPNFIRSHYEELNQCYITILEIGGSHAHRLRGLIDHLGLLTLVITDLDSLEPEEKKSTQPEAGVGQITNNATLKSWVPCEEDVDKLMALADDGKELLSEDDQLFAVRVAYQTPLDIVVPKSGDSETAYPYTFEDALAFENLALFSELEGTGLVRKFHDAAQADSAKEIGKEFYDALKTGKKAEFALDVLEIKNFDDLKVPSYIDSGLKWLLSKLKHKQADIMKEEAIVVAVEEAEEEAEDE